MHFRRHPEIFTYMPLLYEDFHVEAKMSKFQNYFIVAWDFMCFARNADRYIHKCSKTKGRNINSSLLPSMS